MTNPRKKGPSRPERRGARRLAQNMAAYENMKKSSNNGGKEFTAPGKSKMW